MKVKVKINSCQKDYLIENLLEDKALLALFTNTKEYNEAYYIELSHEDADNIRDLCSEMLDMHGFDEKYKLTPDGKILEELIDLFYVN